MQLSKQKENDLTMSTNKQQVSNDDQIDLQAQQEDIELEYDEYLDDEPQRKPRRGKMLRKFRIPLEN
jgi:hypothetical protein